MCVSASLCEGVRIGVRVGMRVGVVTALASVVGGGMTVMGPAVVVVVMACGVIYRVRG